MSYAVDRSRWQSLSIFEQMGNIGSEVGRSFKYLRAGDKQAADAALARAIDLFDATETILLKQNPARAREVLRAKEEYLRSFHERKGLRSLENYFNQFAIAARLNR